MNQDLSTVKVGDVLLHHGGMGSVQKPAEVTGVTATLIKTKVGTFKRRNGYATRFSYGSVSIATQQEFEDAADAVEQRILAQRFNEQDFRKLPLSVLRQINAAIGNTP